MEKVLGIRKQELKALKRSQILFSASLASFNSSTFLVSDSPSYIKCAITSISLCGPVWTDFSCWTARDNVCLEQLVVSQEELSPSGIGCRHLHCPSSSMDKLPGPMTCSKQMEPALQESPGDLQLHKVHSTVSICMSHFCICCCRSAKCVLNREWLCFHLTVTAARKLP